MLICTIMSNFFDTICAISTPLSIGGIGVIRVSGEKALNIVQNIFDKKIEPKMLNHGWIKDKGQKIDEVIVLYFKSPKSYTGEDVLEIQTHGSPIILKKILNLVMQAGARLASRGEFTKRAFLNHKLDLSEAEAVMDLINSTSEKSALLNASNLSGALSFAVKNIRGKLIDILSQITASIDFPEDVEEVPYQKIKEALALLKDEIENILKNAAAHNILREGIKVAVAGRPNVGKSSLFNALLNLNRAIVTDIAGTTRDIINESFEINGVLTTLTDTAGIRPENEADKVETIGIEQAKSAIKDSNIVLLLFDGTKGITKEDEEIFKLAQNKQTILISTKSDICGKTYENALSVSSVTGENIDRLKELICQKGISVDIDSVDFVTNQRQQESLNMALDNINNALVGTENNELQDLISIDIKSAVISLGEITGEAVNDEILNGIFDKFCIGK